MAKSIVDIQKKERRGRGRPAVDSDKVLVTMRRDLLDRLDRWAAAQDDTPGRAEAVRRLLDHSLGRDP